VNSLKLLIADDEQPARSRLRQLVEDMDGWETVAEAQNGHEVVDVCNRIQPDVVLLDIRMPNMDGIETARHLGALDKSPAVIFTTAYDEYAVDAFDAQAIGYLLKPVRRERLERALKHAARLTQPQLSALAERSGMVQARTHICARCGEQLRLIPVDRIRYFQADQKYVKVCHLDGEDLIDESLKDLESEFAERFLRIHRNALIAIKYLDRVEKDTGVGHSVRIKDCADPLPVSRRHVAALKRRLRAGI